jgi:hypothetical protein
MSSAPVKSSHVRTKAADTSEANRPAESTPATVSASDRAATPATVTLKDGILTVEANNSDLAQIVKDVANTSGMTVDGSISSSRVYGTYGPGNPRDVLTTLLTGSGYNFVMVGATQEGGPRELLLTPQNGAPTKAPAPTPTVAASDSSEKPGVKDAEEEPAGPGAIVHVPPAPSDDYQERVQQNLNKLQQMHDQQQSGPQ